MKTEANVIAIGNGRRMPVLNDMNEKCISEEEVKKAVNEMKEGKAPGLDGCPAECIKKGGVCIIKWVVRLFNLCFVSGVVPRSGVKHVLCRYTRVKVTSMNVAVIGG